MSKEKITRQYIQLITNWSRGNKRTVNGLVFLTKKDARIYRKALKGAKS